MDFNKDFYYELYHNILFLSCKYNQEQYLKVALNFKKININEIDSNGLTALIYASKSSDINIVHNLLLKKANVNIKDKYGRTALLRACKNGKLEIVNILLDYGADIKIKGFYWNHNCFDYAYINKHYKIIDSLLDEYIMNIPYKDSFSSTVLIWASFRNRIDIVKIFLSCKIHDTRKKTKIYHKSKNSRYITLHKINIEGKTALFYSIDNNNIEIFNKLLNYSLHYIKRNKLNKNYKVTHCVTESASHYVEQYMVSSQTPPNTVQRSMSSQQNLQFSKSKNIKDIFVQNIIKYEKEAIIHAFSKCNSEIVNKLLKYIKIDINMKNSYGRHILIQLCKNGNIDIIREIFNLSSNPIDINMKDIDGKNALMFACENGYFNIVELILEYELKEIYKESINVNLQDNDEKSALIIASEYGYTNIVELLLKSYIYYKKNKYHVYQIDINLQDTMGFTALSHACDSGYINISKILLEYGKINLFIKDYYYGKTALEWALMKKNFIIVDYIILKEKKYYKNIINNILKNKVKEKISLSLIVSLITSFSISCITNFST